MFIRVLILAALLAAFATGRTVEADEVKQQRPNVLFIAVDDLNNYVLDLNREISAKTPHLEQLAARGTLFTNAHCAAPGCNPSRVSVMTGLAPYNSGIYVNSQDWRNSARLEQIVTLPQHFRENGYKVLGGGKLYHAANLRETMLEGFLDPKPWDEYFPSKSRQLADEVAPARQAINGSNDFYGGRFDWDALDIADNEMGDGKVVAWAEAQLSKEHDQPLFLGVGIYRPHIPWYTPKRWYESFPLDEIQLPEDVDGDLSDIPNPGVNLARQPWHDWLVDHDKWRDATQAYLASVSFADEMVGRLVAALDKGPLADNTIIILWSDHGYHLGHKRHWEKFTLWNQATHVPLIVVDRRIEEPIKRCNEPVSLLDIFPTLTELCALPRVSHLDGTSLVSCMKDAQASTKKAIVITHGIGNHAVQTRDWRYIRYYEGSEELYDHRLDPGERVNLAEVTGHAEELRRLASHVPATHAAADPAIRSNQHRFVVSQARDKQLAVYSVSSHNQLRRESQVPLDAEPGATVFSQNGSFLYVSTTKPDSITVFKTEGTNLKRLHSVAVPAKPSFLELTPSQRFLIAAYYRTGQVTVHRVENDGSLSEEPIQTLFANERAHAVALDRTGEYVFVPHTLPNSISQFKVDAESGELSPNQPSSIQRNSNTGPRHLKFHPTADFAYGSDEQGCSISKYELDPATGTLAHRQTVSSLPQGYDGEATTSDIEIHPNGRFAYIANRIHGSISVFAIDESSFDLTMIQNELTESVPRSFNISPSGKFLILGGQHSGKLVAYVIQSDGSLRRVTDWQAGESINWISFFPSLDD